MKLEAISKRVKMFLSIDEKYRDDDNMLYASIVMEDLARIYPNDDVTSERILYAISCGIVSSPHSVSRSRRKLQEKYPVLRGKKWKERHTSAVTETLTELDKIK